MPSTKKMSVCRGFNRISNSWYNPRWRSLLVTRWASSSAITRKMYLILLTEKIKNFPLKEKIFSKPLRRVLSTPLPPCTTVGVWICVYVRGLNSNALTKSTKFSERIHFWAQHNQIQIAIPNRAKNSAKYESGEPSENVVQNHLNIALLNVC